MHQFTQSTKKQAKVSSRTFLLIFAGNVSTIALLSILLLAFKFDARSIYSNTTYGGSSVDLRPDDKNGGLPLRQYPSTLNDRKDWKPILASAVASIVLALGLGWLCVFVGRRGKALLLSPTQRLVIFTLMAGTCILSITASMICFVHHAQSRHFDPTYREETDLIPPTVGNQTFWEHPSINDTYMLYGPFGVYSGGVFDMATWACEVSGYTPFEDEGHEMGRQCVGESGSLWVSLLLFLANLGIAGLVWWDWKGERVLIREHKDAFRDQHDEEEEDGDYI